MCARQQATTSDASLDRAGAAGPPRAAPRRSQTPRHERPHVLIAERAPTVSKSMPCSLDETRHLALRPPRSRRSAPSHGRLSEVLQQIARTSHSPRRLRQHFRQAPSSPSSQLACEQLTARTQIALAPGDATRARCASWLVRAVSSRAPCLPFETPARASSTSYKSPILTPRLLEAPPLQRRIRSSTACASCSQATSVQAKPPSCKDYLAAALRPGLYRVPYAFLDHLATSPQAMCKPKSTGVTTARSGRQHSRRRLSFFVIRAVLQPT